MTDIVYDTLSTKRSDYLSLSEARLDRWRELGNLGRAWRALAEAGQPTGEYPRQATVLLDELAPLERFWAYPGRALMEVLRTLVAEGDGSGFARLAGRIGLALLSGEYRRNTALWQASEEAEAEIQSRGPEYFESAEKVRLYFEVLVLGQGTPAEQERTHEALRKLRRPEDQFVYEPVFVTTFEDAVVGTILNYNAEAVVIYDGFPFSSTLTNDMPVLRELIERHVSLSAHTLVPQDYGTALAKVIKKIRPELDVYLITDRAVEKLAGNPDAACIQRIFYNIEELMEIHLTLLEGIVDRFETPHFSNLVHYSRRPVGTFHALPIARGKSIYKSHWIQDMGHFYGPNLLLAESSATSGGLDSLLEPTGNIKKAHEKMARAFGADRAYFVTSGTSTSNKIIVQATCQPGDIVLVDRNCHKSHHYGFVLAGVQPIYLEAYPLMQYSMYGGVPLRSIKQALLALKKEGKLQRAKLVDLTNCTFDGHSYNTRRVMEECLAIKPDLIFIWDEAWFGFARFSPFLRGRTAMGGAAALEERYQSPAYRAEYESFKIQLNGELDPDDPRLLEMHLLPDPDTVKVRVYQTCSTHKSMSALRQGSQILIRDQEWHKVHETFEEAWFTHSTTSPSHPIVGSIDCARRQMELEGYELVTKAIELALKIRREVNAHPLISKYFRILTPAEMIPAEFRQSGITDFGPPNGTWKDWVESIIEDEIALDPTRLTLVCGNAGYDGNSFRNLLAERFDIQLNKTSRNSVLVQININNSRSDAAQLIKVLAGLAREIDEQLAESTAGERETFAARVRSLTVDVPEMPNFSCFHDAFRDNPASATPEGHIRAAFYMAYREEDCEHIKLTSQELQERLRNGPELVSANFVIPYPPGFPIMVPGQVISAEIIEFMRKLDVKEIHGYHAAAGLKCLKPDALAAHKAHGAGI